MSEKMYRIGEAAELLNLKSYVLRFWETEFPQLAPLRTDHGQRLYSEEHIALLRRIKQLLHEQGMTIDGAVCSTVPLWWIRAGLKGWPQCRIRPLLVCLSRNLQLCAAFWPDKSRKNRDPLTFAFKRQFRRSWQ